MELKEIKITKKESEMIKQLGLTWEDPITDDDGNVWARVCKECVKKHEIPESMLDGPGAGVEGSLCDILDCQNEQDFYIDF